MIEVLKSKIHRATVTDANLDYEGSISICPTLLTLAHICMYEAVHVWNVTNGYRMKTYALAGKPGEICINGAGAHHNKKGDLVIIATFETLEANRLSSPKLVFVDENNICTSLNVGLYNNKK